MSDQDTSPRIEHAPVAPRTRWQRFRLIVKVVELRLRFIALMAITGLLFAYWDTLWNHYDKWMRPAPVKTAAAAGIEYYCPMHPQVVREEPGTCPICGMPLAKRKKGEKESLPEGILARVRLTPYRIAQAGIQTADVRYTPLVETVTAVGEVVHDETRYSIISSKIKGMTRVERLFVNYIGSPVAEGQPLAEIYSPELYTAAQELLLAQRAAQAGDRPQSGLGRAILGNSSTLFQSAVAKLELWGISQAQIDQITKSGKADYRVTILAPRAGHVTRKNVVEGQIVPEGYEMFVIADLSHVWVKAQIFEDQVAMLHAGQAVEATVDAYPGERFPGRVAFIDPELDPATRTIGVRYDLENPGHKLRPGMFATVTLRVPVAETPMFAARRAASHSRTHLARMTAEEQKTCPVTGVKLGTMGAPVSVEAKGQTVWTCCPACPPKVKAAPEKYLAKLAPPPADGVLTVPESAVIDTGTQKVVYVETEPGVYEGRSVVLGPRSGDRYAVLEGLTQGDKVVASGAFLVDAESRINPITRPEHSVNRGGHSHGASAPAADSVPTRVARQHPHRQQG